MKVHKLAVPEWFRLFCDQHVKLLLLSVFVVGLLVRLFWLGADFNITADMPILRGWIIQLQEEGLVSFYGSVGDRAYPPLSIYLLAGGGWLADKVVGHPQVGQSAVPNDSLLNALIKLPAILAALLVWQAKEQSAVWRILTAALYLLNPAVWYVSVYWGQTDAVYVFFLAAGLMLLARGAVVPAWLCYTLSLATKLQGLPLLFLFLGWTLVQYGRRALAKGLAVSGVTTVLLLLPWLLNGRLLEVIRATVSGSTRVVQSAYNGWYFLLRDGAGMAVVTQRIAFLPFSYQSASLLLFLMALPFVTILIVRGEKQLSLPIAAVILTLSAFLFLPDIRERYLFPVLPLLLWGAAKQRVLLWPYFVLTGSWLFNLVTIASFAPGLWTNLVAWQRPYPARIALLKAIAWVVSAVHLVLYLWLCSLLIVLKKAKIPPSQSCV